MEGSKLVRIDNQINSLDLSIDAYFEKYTVNQFDQVLNNSNYSDPTKNYSRDQDIIEQIEICNRLWIIKGLMKELEVFNGKDIDLANVILNYNKLAKKNHELNEFLNSSGVNTDNVSIIKDLKINLTMFNDKITECLKEYFKNYFVFDNELNFIHNSSYNSVNFDEYLKLCETFLNEEITSLFDLRKVFIEWTEESLSKIEDGYKNDVQIDEANKSIKLSYKKQPFDLTNYFDSIKNYISLFNYFVVDHKVFQFVKFSVCKILLEHIRTQIFSTHNIGQLLIYKYNQVDHSTCVDQLKEISELLSTNKWSPDNHNDLEFWIDDLQTFYIDNIVDKTIDEFKIFVKAFQHGDYDKQLNEIITENLTADNTNQKEKPENEALNWNAEWDDEDGETKEEDSQKKENEDDNFADDAWNEQIDLDLDEEEEQAKGKTNDDADDDGWDAWDDDAADLQLEETTVQNKETANAPVYITSYKCTAVSNEILNAIDKYYSNVNNFQGLISKTALNDFEQLIKHNIKKLMTSLFMMFQFDISKTYKNEILFYNDFTRVLESCYIKFGVDLTSLFKLASRYISNYLNTYYLKVCDLFNEYNNIIWNDSATDFRKGKLELLIRFNNNFDAIVEDLNKYKDLNTTLIDNSIVTMNFKVFNIICEKILSRNDISSEESVMFSEIITEIIKIIQQHYSLVSIQSFNKIKQINVILNSSLKEIMQRFYDAEFYEMETFELINLIKALFVDSANRDDVLDQIQSVRNAQLE